MLFRIFGQGCCFPHHLLDSKPNEDLRRTVRVTQQHQPDEMAAGKVKTLEKRLSNTATAKPARCFL
jgi:hypothetical protein